MGKQIVAEWVESAPVLDRLRELGVDHAQGHAIAAPRLLYGASVAGGLTACDPG